ncbi:MAG: hypothetical protein WCV86_03940 [Patescibacteria group bacterium]|jgi:hypothetical protein
MTNRLYNTVFRSLLQLVVVFGGMVLFVQSVSALAINPPGPRVQSVTATSATVYWTTDAAADATVELTDTVTGTVKSSTISAPSTIHTVIVESLSPSTTYTYTVTSFDGTNTVSATGATNIVTPANIGDTTAPKLLSPGVGVSCGAVSCTAYVLYQSDELAISKVWWGLTSPPANGPLTTGIYDTNFSTSITSLSHATDYFYTIHLQDAAGNFREYGPLTFTTCAVGEIGCFSVGQCFDGTPLGSCNEKAEYCDGGTLELNCTACGYQCQIGATCKTGGACISDPPVTDNTYQCNPISCYEPDGTFTQPAGAGCFRSWPKCNSNVVLKVRNDRECKRWIDCRSSIEVKDPVSKSVQQLCTSLANCAQIDVTTGECTRFLPERQCQFNPGRFCSKNEDCAVFDEGDCLPAGTSSALTFNTNRDLGNIRYLTGAVKAGLEWSAGGAVSGQYPWAFAREDGASVNVLDNNEFEDVEEVYTRDAQGVAITKKQFTTDPWFPVGGVINAGTPQQENLELDTNGKASKITVNSENAQDLNNPNHVLWIYPNSNEFSGARAPVSGFFATDKDQYQISLRIKGTGLSDQVVLIQLLHKNTLGEFEYPEDARTYVKLTTGWQNVAFQANGVSSTTYLQIVNTFGGQCLGAGTYCREDSECPDVAFGKPGKCMGALDQVADPSPFLVDDVYIQPSLKVSNSDSIARSCRLFPRGDSLSCAYNDQNGIQYQGWRGFCLEQDPSNASKCVSWWPVDVIAGDTAVLGSFGGETQDGYAGRKPVYYCLEAAGRAMGVEIDRYQITAKYFMSRCANCTFPDFPDAGWPESTSECNGKESGGVWGESFWVCGDNESSSWDIEPDWPEYDFYQYEIDSIEVKRTNGRGEYPANFFLTEEDRHLDSSNNEYWEFVQASSSTKNLLRFQVHFDVNGKVASYSAETDDDTEDKNEPGLFLIYYHMREWCNKIVQVVDDSGQNKAWTQRLQPSSSYSVPDLNYNLATDFTPFGGIIPPPGTPESWDGDVGRNGNQPLYIEAPQINDPALQEPLYQARAGTPYACLENCDARLCAAAGNKTGAFCKNADDCVGEAAGLPVFGRCIGVGTCENTARHCNINYTCPAKPGTEQTEQCIGGDASYKGGQAFTYNQSSICSQSGNYCSKTSVGLCYITVNLPVGGPVTLPTGTSCSDPIECAGPNATCVPTPTGDGSEFCEGVGDVCTSVSGKATFAVRRLQRLFAESYGAWQWNNETRRYERLNGNVTWDPPSKVCNVRWCEDNSGRGCVSDLDCSGSTCSPNITPGVRPPTYNDTVAAADLDYCGVPPQIFNVSVNGEETTTRESDDIVRFEFNTTADPNQLPLESILVNWGDGDVQGLSFPYAPKQDTDNPHVFIHAYSCIDGTEGEDDGRLDICTFKPKALVRDNWGFCNNFWNSDPTAPSTLKCDIDNTDVWAPNEWFTEPGGKQQEEVLVIINAETPAP